MSGSSRRSRRRVVVSTVLLAVLAFAVGWARGTSRPEDLSDLGTARCSVRAGASLRQTVVVHPGAHPVSLQSTTVVRVPASTPEAVVLREVRAGSQERAAARRCLFGDATGALDVHRDGPDLVLTQHDPYLPWTVWQVAGVERDQVRLSVPGFRRPAPSDGDVSARSGLLQVPGTEITAVLQVDGADPLISEDPTSRDGSDPAWTWVVPAAPAAPPAGAAVAGIPEPLEVGVPVGLTQGLASMAFLEDHRLRLSSGTVGTTVEVPVSSLFGWLSVLAIVGTVLLALFRWLPRVQPGARRRAVLVALPMLPLVVRLDGAGTASSDGLGPDVWGQALLVTLVFGGTAAAAWPVTRRQVGRADGASALGVPVRWWWISSAAVLLLAGGLVVGGLLGGGEFLVAALGAGAALAAVGLAVALSALPARCARFPLPEGRPGAPPPPEGRPDALTGPPVAGVGGGGSGAPVLAETGAVPEVHGPAVGGSGPTAGEYGPATWRPRASPSVAALHPWAVWALRRCRVVGFLAATLLVLAAGSYSAGMLGGSFRAGLPPLPGQADQRRALARIVGDIGDQLVYLPVALTTVVAVVVLAWAVTTVARVQTLSRAGVFCAGFAWAVVAGPADLVAFGTGISAGAWLLALLVGRAVRPALDGGRGNSERENADRADGDRAHGAPVSPTSAQVAAVLQAGPTGTVGGDLRVSIGLAALLSVVPVSFVFWGTLTRLPGHTIRPSDAIFVVAALFTEILRWLLTGWVYGLLHRRLPGAIGPVKAMVLLACWFAAAVPVEIVNRWSGAGSGRVWVFPGLQLAVFLFALSVLHDLVTVHEHAAARRWPSVNDALQAGYRIQSTRHLIAYLVPPLLTVIAIGQQVVAGTGIDFVKSLLAGVPTLTNFGGGG